MLRSALRFFILSLLLLTVSLASDIERLISWKPQKNHPGMILPVLNGETPQMAIDRYRNTLYKTKDLDEAMKKHKVTRKMISGNTYEVVSLDALKESPRPNFLLIANQFNDYTSKYYRIWNFLNPINKNGGVAYLLPISVDASLNKNQAQEFRDLVARSFDSLFGMGGDDVDPKLYGEEVTHSVNIVPTRDLSEVKMIKTYIQKKRGVYFGICRGSQICFVAKGGKLHQDIFSEGVTDEHVDVWHKVKLVKDDDNLLRAFTGKDEVDIYSYHHQAVREGTADVSINSVEGTGVNRVVEGYQFKNGLGLTFQFHPEMMHNKDGDAIMAGVVKYSSFVKENRFQGPSCFNLASKFLSP
ncbi:MAG: putative glutamine amidotransferase [Bacteriovoracaceae bacterium]|jgi:putative glutamine amidotransferase